jgi:hypothetical protein
MKVDSTYFYNVPDPKTSILKLHPVPTSSVALERLQAFAGRAAFGAMKILSTLLSIPMKMLGTMLKVIMLMIVSFIEWKEKVMARHKKSKNPFTRIKSNINYLYLKNYEQQNAHIKSHKNQFVLICEFKDVLAHVDFVSTRAQGVPPVASASVAISNGESKQILKVSTYPS